MTSQAAPSTTSTEASQVAQRSAPRALTGPKSRLRALLAYLRDPVGCMLPIVRRYGDPFVFPGAPPLVCVGTPAGIQAIYGAEPDTFEPLIDDMGQLLGQSALL